jgi:hypothetical protein
MEIAAYTSTIASAARWAFGIPQDAGAFRAPAGRSAADVLEKYNPHDMSRREAFAMMKEMEQNGLLPPGRSALDMTALHRPGERVWNVDMDAKFDVVEAVRANHAYVTRTPSTDASTAGFVKAQFDVWNDVAALACRHGIPA